MNTHEEETYDEPLSIADEMMLRGQRLRELRRMLEEDEEERRKSSCQLEEESIQLSTVDTNVNIQNLNSIIEKDLNLTNHTLGISASTSETSSMTGILEDQIDILPDSNLKTLRYDSYLAHQRYHDDYKHSSCTFIDYQIENKRGKLCRTIVEQSRLLGKGGLVWDAAVMLSEHLLAKEDEWNDSEKTGRRCKVLELGCGTGFTGLALAKATVDTHIFISDLPDLYPIMERNVKRNFLNDNIDIKTPVQLDDIKTMERGDAAADIPTKRDNGGNTLSDTDIKTLYEFDAENYTEKIKTINETSSKITPTILRWGIKEDYSDGPFDVIIGADIITSLYDPKALAQTIYDLCHEKTKVYVCFKKRLEGPHTVFENAMKTLFNEVSFMRPITRLHIPTDIAVLMVANAKRK
jgi:predicted nicotinamide N-methyase